MENTSQLSGEKLKAKLEEAIAEEKKTVLLLAEKDVDYALLHLVDLLVGVMTDIAQLKAENSILARKLCSLEDWHFQMEWTRASKQDEQDTATNP